MKAINTDRSNMQIHSYACRKAARQRCQEAQMRRLHSTPCMTALDQPPSAGAPLRQNIYQRVFSSDGTLKCAFRSDLGEWVMKRGLGVVEPDRPSVISVPGVGSEFWW